MAVQFLNIIDDDLRGSKKVDQVVDPRTEQSLWSIPVASAEDLDDAVAAAVKAFPSWAKSTAKERQAALVKLGESMKTHRDELVDILMKETGKSVILPLMASYHGIGSTVELEDSVTFEDDKLKIVTTHTPLGVVGAISPWNFPLILSTMKIVSALSTGNCVIVKPSPLAAGAVLKMVEHARGILPKGVLQCLHGGADLGSAMTAHADIAAISFTGSTAVGRRIMAACAPTLKRVILELGGNDAAIVCADANPALAAAKTAATSFFNAGQMCVATKRIYVHESVLDRFLALFLAQVDKGPHLSVQADASAPSLMGPVFNQAQFGAVKGVLDDCTKNGYQVVSGSSSPLPEKGFWIRPTVIKNPPEDSLLVREEQFGPVVPILSWSDEDDVVRRANLRNAGLGACVYSADAAHAERIARRLESGTVWINMAEQPHPAAFFGGMKDSGLGGEFGKHGLLSYCYTKTLQIAK